jgi:DNA-binding response OmpR family regulator
MKKILITEDDQKTGAALGIRLKAADYDVQIVPDGLRSYLRAMVWQPDLILMDILIPVGNGLEVAKELERAGVGEIPIIFMTASTEKNLKTRAKELNAAGFFEKPLDTEKLLSAISHALHSEPSTTKKIKK